MDEVRGGGGAASADTTDAAVSEDTSDSSEPADESDPSDTSDTARTVDEEPTSTESEVEDTPDTEAVPESSDAEDTSDTSDTIDMGEEDPVSQAEGETIRRMALDAEDKGLAVRDLHNVNVSLFASVYHDMRTKFKELDTEYYAAHGGDLSKNTDFFNAVFRAGLQSPQLKEALEIE